MDRKAEQGAPPARSMSATEALAKLAAHPCAHAPACGHGRFSECRDALVASIERAARIAAQPPSESSLFSVLKALLEDMEGRYDSVYPATAWMGPHIGKARAALAKADGTAK